MLWVLMKLWLVMTWRQTTMKSGRRRGSSRQTQCGRPEARPLFEKEKTWRSEKYWRSLLNPSLIPVCWTTMWSPFIKLTVIINYHS
jgi:hypothetical protein